MKHPSQFENWGRMTALPGLQFAIETLQTQLDALKRDLEPLTAEAPATPATAAKSKREPPLTDYPVHCKKCHNLTLPNISALRKHQWKKHPEIYAKMFQKHPKGSWTEARKAKFRKVLAAKKAARYVNGSAAA